MNEFEKLIKEKQQVNFYQDGDFNKEPIKCIVVDYKIDDFYFYNKNEPIYITLNLAPIITTKIHWNDEWDIDTFINVPLDYVLLN